MPPHVYICAQRSKNEIFTTPGLLFIRRDRGVEVYHKSWRRAHEEGEVVKDKLLRKKIPP